MDLREQYLGKLTTPQEAVSHIRSGDWVDYGFCANHPVLLDKALAKRLEEEPALTGLQFRGSITPWQPEVTKLPDAKERLIWHSWHFTAVERAIVDRGFISYTPLRFFEVPGYYRHELPPMDVAMFQVSPMDEKGRFFFSLSPSFLSALCERAKYIILEVNPQMPVCPGGEGTWISLDRVDAIVENPAGRVFELPGRKPDPVDRQVAEQILPLIPNGACLELGIGGMPNALGQLIAASDLKDLGVHTEMLGDGFLSMAKAGKLTGARKNLDRGKSVFTFAMGSEALYRYMDGNPALLAAPVDYVNDPAVIAAQDNFVAINNTVEIDLLGQAASEGSGLKHISGAGGQLDYLLGAYRSKGGKSFLCCSSTFTTRSGVRKSRIVPTLSPGSVVTAPRPLLQYLVTEYGVVNLKALNTWQRAEAILSLAHPDFREELIAQAGAMGLWRPSNRR